MSQSDLCELRSSQCSQTLQLVKLGERCMVSTILFTFFVRLTFFKIKSLGEDKLTNECINEKMNECQNE